jgi:hypothetical protein
MVIFLRVRFPLPLQTLLIKLNKMIVGSKAIWGCDLVEICSIIVNGFVIIKVEHNKKRENVHIDNLMVLL